MKKYCTKCGKEMDESAVFCPACGTPAAKTPETVAPVPYVPNQNEANTRKTISGLYIALGVATLLGVFFRNALGGVFGLIVAVVAAVVAGGAWLYVSSCVKKGDPYKKILILHICAALVSGIMGLITRSYLGGGGSILYLIGGVANVVVSILGLVLLIWLIVKLVKKA